MNTLTLFTSMMDKRINELFDSVDRPLLSYEFFPPKDDQGMELLHESAAQLLETKPDFVTCTYGAGGSTRDRTLLVCEELRGMGFGPVMPHLTCVGSSRDDLLTLADDIYARGFRNIMTLRGDPPKGQAEFKVAEDGLPHAIDLVKLLKEQHPDFCCGVAGFPETHPEATSPDDDVRHLFNKLAAGGDFVTTQLFYENQLYYDYVRRCRAAGITQPIIPGLLPATSLGQLKRITSMCQASFPDELASQLERLESDPTAAASFGIQWTVRQIRDLLAKGAPGIHLYVLNRANVALAPAVVECFK